MKFSWLIIFCCFLFIQCPHSATGQTSVDSLSQAIIRSSPKELPGLHKEMGVIHYKKRDFPKAEMAFRECIKAALKINDGVMAGKCSNNLGGVAFQQGDYARGILHYRKAIDIYKANQLDTLLGDGFLNLGLAYKKLNIYDSATTNFYKGIKILEKGGSKSGLMYGYNMLANTWREVNSLENARQNYLNSINMAKILSDTLQISKVYNNLGTLFRQRQELDSAVYYYRKSLILKKERKVPKSTGNTYYNLGITFIDLQRSDGAIRYLNKSSEYRLLSYDSVGLAFNLIALSKAYLQKRDTLQANYFLKRFDSLSLWINYPPNLVFDQLVAQRNLAEVQNKFREASEISRKLIKLRESILNAEKQDVISAYEVRFNVNDLEQALEIEASIRQKNQLIYLLSSIIAALIILSLVYYGYAKQKKAKKAKKEAENAEKESEKDKIRYNEMHHRIKNILSLFSGMITHKRNHVKDSIAKRVLYDIGKQLDAINLIMQRLYFSKTSNEGQLNFGKYLKELTQNLFYSTGINQGQYKIESNLDPVQLTADQSNPLGLIVNEVLTNAIKYGQNKDGTWTVKIDLHEEGDNVKLCIVDNGLGFKCQDSGKANTSGMGLIELLTRQMKGKYTYTGDTGGKFIIRFKK